MASRNSIMAEAKVVSLLRHGRILPIVLDMARAFKGKYDVLPTEIGINAKVYDAVIKEAEVAGLVYRIANQNDAYLFLRVEPGTDPVRMVGFLPTKQQMKTRPDMEWLFLNHVELKVVEVL